MKFTECDFKVMITEASMLRTKLKGGTHYYI